MTREQLEHAIRAACDVTGDDEVYVFGSQAILGQYPDAPALLRMSVEADIAPKNHPERVNEIDGVLGELSSFHTTHGFYVHGVPMDAAILPRGWERRAVQGRSSNTLGKTGWCVEGHDLAASKLAAFREKDREFVRVLLIERLVTVPKLMSRILVLPRDRANIDRLVAWLNGTAN